MRFMSTISLQRVKSDVTIATVSLGFLVEGTVRGRRRIISWRRSCRSRYRWDRRWCRRCRMHSHVPIQRDLLVGTVRTMRTSVGLPYFELARLLLVFVVGRVFFETRSMGAIEGTMSLQSAGRTKTNTTGWADQGSWSGRFNGDRFFSVGWQDEQTTRCNR